MVVTTSLVSSGGLLDGPLVDSLADVDLPDVSADADGSTSTG